MKQLRLYEDKLPSKLYVAVSSQINKDINAIEAYNQNNAEALSQWHDYIEGIMRYISNPAIAWDYVGRYPHFPNGAIFVSDFGYSAAFIVKTNFKTNQPFVYLFKLNLNLEAFGLKIPPLKEKSLFSVSESDIKNMVMECVGRILEAKQYKKVGKWTIVDGNYFQYNTEHLGKKHSFDVRMYDDRNAYPFNTICLMQRCDNGKYFYTKIIIDEKNPHQAKFALMPLSEVPQEIRQDFRNLPPPPSWVPVEIRWHKMGCPFPHP